MESEKIKLLKARLVTAECGLLNATSVLKAIYFSKEVESVKAQLEAKL
jgi:hypothetical protein